MKKHLSIFMIIIQNRLIRLLAILLGTALLQGLAFLAFGGNSLPLFFDKRFVNAFTILAGIGYVLLTLLCAYSLGEVDSTKYTLQRLSVSERSFFLWTCLASVLCFLMYWMTELLVVFALGTYYYTKNAALFGPQGLTVALYRCSIFHGLLPLIETRLWVRNFLFALLFGIYCTGFNLGNVHKSRGLSFSVVPIMLMAMLVPAEIGQNFIIPFVFFGIMAFIVVMQFFLLTHNGKRRDSDE